jgi:hypothetical protein
VNEPTSPLDAWPWAGKQPEDDRELGTGTWPAALALAGRRAADNPGQRYQVDKAGDRWRSRRTAARHHQGERPPHQHNEFGTDMDEVRTNRVVTFDNGQRGLVVRMDTQRWGVIELYDKDGELTGETAMFHAANVWIVQ